MSKPVPFDGSGSYQQVAIAHLPVVAELTEPELRRALAVPFEERMLGGVRLPVALPAARALEESDADAGQVLDPAADINEPEGLLEKIASWKAKAVYATSAVEYEQAVAHVTALTGTPGTAWEQDVLDRTIAAQARGDLKTTEAQAAADARAAERIMGRLPSGAPIEPLPKAHSILMRDPLTDTERWVTGTPLTKRDLIAIAKLTTRQYTEPGIEPPPRTKTVRIKKIMARDPTTENISEIHEWDVECAVDPVTGAPIVPPGP